MQEFSEMTSMELLEFAGSKPARAALQFLAHRYPDTEWNVRSYRGKPSEPWSAQYMDGHGNTKVLHFTQRGIAWLIEEVPG